MIANIESAYLYLAENEDAIVDHFLPDERTAVRFMLRQTGKLSLRHRAAADVLIQIANLHEQMAVYGVLLSKWRLV